VLTELLYIFLIVVPGTSGEICVSRAMKRVGEVTDFRPHAIVRVIGQAMKVPWMWIGLLLMTMGFFALLEMLSIANVSFVRPATALSYAVGALGGKLFLGERVTPQRWLGVLIVCTGVVLVFIG
jgi:multidrug transporter EmrE-like cation transporter